MKRVVAAAYSAPQDAAALDEEPLVIHQRTEGGGNDQLILFVHGLGGSRYGDKSTWGNFPCFLFEDIPSADIGMYQYRTATGRFAFTKSVSLEDEARLFADLVRDELKAYKTVVLVGHSMGGLLCKAMIHRLCESGARQTLGRVGGLVLMATPQLGSLRMPGFLGALSFDARALAPHGDLVTSINRTFEDHIALDERTYTIRKVTIPTWAVEGVSDRWVDSLSAGIGLPSSRRKVVRGSHTSIVKPNDKSADAYSWVRQRIETALHRFKYDVFVASAMAAHQGDAEYRQEREDVMAIIDVLQRHCSCPAPFYAGAKLASQADFEPELLSFEDDLQAMRDSRNFLLYYPQRVASSVLYEAGWALVMGKPCVYVTRPGAGGNPLPFLLKQASQAFDSSRVRVLECADTPAVLKTLEQYGERLFRFGANEE